MVKRLALPIAIFVAGLLLGGVSVHYEQVKSFQTSKEAFARKAHCKVLADRYVQSQNSDANIQTLQEVGYSSSANTCVAAITTMLTGEGIMMRNWHLVDLTSGKTIGVGACNDMTNCGNGEDAKIQEELDRQFDAAIKGTGHLF